jgi:PIN domain nuclease of toxin-antitoxin system
VTVVLDASAVLVLLLDQPGAEAVAEALPGAALGTVALSEVLGALGDRGVVTSGLADHLAAAGVRFEPLSEPDALAAAQLRGLDRDRVLSLGDRCTLALAQRLSAAVLTADLAWSALDVGVEVRQLG